MVDKSVTHSGRKQASENKTAIILGYFDGAAHITDQLRSIFEQSHQNLHVFICDDQSPNPFSLDKAKIKAENYAKISISVNSENVGFTNNFLNGLGRVGVHFEFIMAEHR